MSRIVDEIFALSTYIDQECDPADPNRRLGFTSILAIDPWHEAQCNPSRIHMM